MVRVSVAHFLSGLQVKPRRSQLITAVQFLISQQFGATLLYFILYFLLSGQASSSASSGLNSIQRHPHVFHPGDLNPFTRRPLFIIVDSDNSTVFKHIPNLFGQALAVLMSPEVVPDKFQADSPVRKLRPMHSGLKLYENDAYS